MKVGKRIDLIELIDEENAVQLYGQSWLKNTFKGKKGTQYPHVYYGEEGYCTWNYRIHISSDSFFDKTFKKIGTFVITKIK